MPNVLCRLPNHVGDCCMALPGLRLLEASGFTPILTGKRWAEDLMAGMGWRFDPIEGHVTEDLSRIRNLAHLAGGNPLGLLYPNSFSSALLFKVGGIRSAGFPTDARSLLLDKKVPEPEKNIHEVERFFRLTHGAIQAWGGKPAWDTPPEALGLKLLARHEAAARNLIEDLKLAPIARGIHIGQEKHWKHFNALCQPLRDRGIEPVVFPSPHEEDDCRKACPDARVCPPTSLGNYSALAKHAQIVIANDSGISHIAAAVGAKQITLIGVTTVERTGPWNKKALVLGSIASGWPSVENVLAGIDRLLG